MSTAKFDLWWKVPLVVAAVLVPQWLAWGYGIAAYGARAEIYGSVWDIYYQWFLTTVLFPLIATFLIVPPCEIFLNKSEDLPSPNFLIFRFITYPTMGLCLGFLACFWQFKTTGQRLLYDVYAYPLFYFVMSMIATAVYALYERFFYNLRQREIYTENLRQAHKRQKLLREIDVAFHSRFELDELLPIVFQWVVEAMCIEAGSIWTLDQDEQKLVCQVATGEADADLPGSRLPIGTALVGHVAQTGQTVNIPNLSQSVQRFAAIDATTTADIRSILCVPMKIRQSRVIGVIQVINRLDGLPFDESDRILLESIATSAADAVETATFIDELRQLNQRITTLNQALAKSNERLRELDKLKSSFLGVITHELRSPFVAIDFSLQIISRHGHEHFAPGQREQFTELEKAVSNMKAMIDNLINFSSLLVKQGPLSLDSVDLIQVVKETIPPLENMSLARHLTFLTELPDSLPAIQGDGERLSEAIYHLVHNAIKFNHEGGRVIVRCRCEDNYVALEVEDTGIGIPEDKLGTLWDGFIQLTDPLRRGVEGLGLGLALVQYVVHAHHGETWVTTQEGVGSTFGFRLPVGAE